MWKKCTILPFVMTSFTQYLNAIIFKVESETKAKEAEGEPMERIYEPWVQARTQVHLSKEKYQPTNTEVGHI